ncbi:alpha/beta fold hydrolase [Aquibaculum sediminis]|uniref:alpha/beta fold hydrolase n=1 Tax=Aquibaculum sediminis TaxID=3231907 RepID=UPI00345248A4
MSEKTPLALLPGLLLDGTFWHHQVAALADIAEPWVADFTSQESVAAMAQSVLAAMPERFALCGLSMGGYVAQEIMRQAPERVERLALLDTKARPDDADTTARRRGLIELAQKGAFKGVTPRLLPLLIHPDRLEDEELTRHIMEMAEAVGRDAFLRQQQAILDRADYRPLLASIRCPTLVLCGREDQLTPADLHTELAASIADARLVVLENCGHLPPLERPEATNRELRRWLLA